MSRYAEQKHDHLQDGASLNLGTDGHAIWQESRVAAAAAADLYFLCLIPSYLAACDPTQEGYLASKGVSTTLERRRRHRDRDHGEQPEQDEQDDWHK
jgi:hypothetical protein